MSDWEKGVTIFDVLGWSCTELLTQHPNLNARFGDKVAATFKQVNLAIAVATEASLTAPAAYEADRLGLSELAYKRRDVIEKALLETRKCTV